MRESSNLQAQAPFQKQETDALVADNEKRAVVDCKKSLACLAGAFQQDDYSVAFVALPARNAKALLLRSTNWLTMV
jgi:hypothetical protein